MPEYDDNGDLIEEPVEDSQVVKTLRKKADQADAAEARAKAAETKVALYDAGLGHLSDKQRNAILATHDGELEGEALKATALELGFVKAEEATEQIAADEQATHGRVAAATAGADPASAQGKTLEDEINAATSREEVEAIIRRSGGAVAGERD